MAAAVRIEESLSPMGISHTRLASDIDVPVSRIAEIVTGRRSFTADTALQLAERFGTEPQMWVNLQASYDLRVAEQSYWPEAKARIRARA
jgi:addiction module HigA family antidote